MGISSGLRFDPTSVTHLCPHVNCDAKCKDLTPIHHLTAVNFPLLSIRRIIMIAAYVVFSICLLLSVVMTLKPSVFTKLNIRYFSAVLKSMGYDIELKPTSPNKPEKLMRIWGMIGILVFLFLLILVYLTTRQ